MREIGIRRRLAMKHFGILALLLGVFFPSFGHGAAVRIADEPMTIGGLTCAVLPSYGSNWSGARIK